MQETEVPVKNLTLGEKIRSLRLERELTIPEVSKLAGVVGATISDIERNKIANPSVYTVHKLCKALRVSILYLLEDGIERTPGTDTSKVNYLMKKEYIHFLQDERFQEYFSATQRAFSSGIAPEVLNKIVDAIALQKG